MWRVWCACWLACLASLASAQPSDLLSRSPNLHLRYGTDQRENDNLGRIDEAVGLLAGLVQPSNPVLGVGSPQRLGVWFAASNPQFTLDVSSNLAKTVIAGRGQHASLGAGLYLASDVGQLDLRLSRLDGSRPWTIGIDPTLALPTLDFCPSYGCGSSPVMSIATTGVQFGTVGDNKAVDQILSATLTTDFASVTNGCSTLANVTVNGAVPGEAVTLGIPPTALGGSSCVFLALVSSNDTVGVKACGLGGTCDPAAATYRVIVTSIGN